MKFRLKILFTYSLVVMVLIMISGVILGSLSYNHMEQMAFEEIHTLAGSLSGRMDETIRSMIFMTDFLLSDSRSVTAINVLGRVERQADGPRYVWEAKQVLSVSLITYLSEINFYRIVYFNSLGDIISSNTQINVIADGNADLDRISRLQLINNAEGKPVLLAPYIDPWNPVNPQKVFGIARLIMGNNFPSYLEVQQPCSMLEYIFSADDSDSVLTGMANSLGEIFFSNLNEYDENFLLEYLNGKVYTSDNMGFFRILERNRLKETEENDFSFRIGSNIAAVRYSPYTDTYIAVIRTGKSMASSFAYIAWITFGLSLVVWIISVGVIYILSIRITAPVSNLVSRMESTNLENITNDTASEKTNDEFTKLYLAYNQLLTRLSYSIEQEKQMNLLHLQAEFNTLQAQVNPHFLYNVLNVLSHRGVVNGDESICRICEELAAMMRYSAEVSNRMVSFRDELDYVEHYLYLLKTRYQNKLVYKIESDPAPSNAEISGMEIHNSKNPETRLVIPKMVIQPLVENSINHGFRNKTGLMEITIRFHVQENGWFVEVEDNGNGFEKKVLDEINHKTAEIRQRVIKSSRNLEINMGGMGLLNIYARLYIIYSDNIIFKIDCSGKGSVVIVGSAGKNNV